MKTLLRPLQGRKVLVTRPAGQEADLVRAIEDRGGQALWLPLTAVMPAADPGPLDQALSRLPEWDWVVFTSPNAVTVTLTRLDELGLAPDRPLQLPGRTAVVGPGTAAALAPWGLVPAVMPDRFRWQELATALTAAAAPGVRVLLPRSDRAQPHLPAALARAGFLVTEVVAYRTRLLTDSVPAVTALLQAGELAAVTLTSPSAVTVFAAAWRPVFNGQPGRPSMQPLTPTRSAPSVQPKWPVPTATPATVPPVPTAPPATVPPVPTAPPATVPPAAATPAAATPAAAPPAIASPARRAWRCRPTGTAPPAAATPPRRPLVACIGPNTAAAATDLGIPVDIIPPKASGPDLAAALGGFFGDEQPNDN